MSVIPYNILLHIHKFCDIDTRRIFEKTFYWNILNYKVNIPEINLYTQIYQFVWNSNTYFNYVYNNKSLYIDTHTNPYYTKITCFIEDNVESIVEYNEQYNTLFIYENVD